MNPTLACMIAGAAQAAAAAAPAGFRVSPAAAPGDLPVLPWSVAEPVAYARLGAVRHTAGHPLASIEGAWSAAALHLRVIVEDAEHSPPPDAGRLWAADSIEVGLDLYGDGVPPASRTPHTYQGADDFKFIFGLLEAQAAAATLVSAPGVPVTAEALAQAARITRTGEPAARTVYELALPWRLLGVAGGVHPTLGVDVQVNNREPGQSAEKTPFHWGAGLAQGFAPALMNRFRLGAPQGAFAAAEWSKAVVWDGFDHNVLSVGLRSDTEVALEIEAGERRETLMLPGGEGLRCHRVEVPAAGDGARLSARLPGAAPAAVAQTHAQVLFARLQERAAERAAAPGIPPLFRLHLDSVAALAATEWGRVVLMKEENPARARESVELARRVLAGLEADAGEWQAYLDGERPLLVSYVSPHDQSVQYYLLGLPRDWDGKQAYPLFLELHGAGSNHPLDGPGSRIGRDQQALQLHGYASPKTHAQVARAGYWVHPFGRGNLGYQGIALVDVLEAYDHAHRLVRIDPDRRYLYGFSMGGGGAFTLARATPSRWAAAASLAPAVREGQFRSYLMPNFSHLPFKLVTGEQDTRFAAHQVRIADELRALGVAVEARLEPGLGHSYRSDLQQEVHDWLVRHRRARPAAFSFATDDPLTSDCWGVRLRVDPGLAPFARASVRIDGQTVHLDSEGTRQVSLDFSAPDGLGLVGDVSVLWNGREAYRGTAKPLTLDRGGPESGRGP